MPILEIESLERPFQVFEAQTCLDPQILSNIFGIIIVNEIEPIDRPVDCRHQCQQRQADEGILSAERGGRGAKSRDGRIGPGFSLLRWNYVIVAKHFRTRLRWPDEMA